MMMCLGPQNAATGRSHQGQLSSAQLLPQKNVGPKGLAQAPARTPPSHRWEAFHTASVACASAAADLTDQPSSSSSSFSSAAQGVYSLESTKVGWPAMRDAYPMVAALPPPPPNLLPSTAPLHHTISTVTSIYTHAHAWHARAYTYTPPRHAGIYTHVHMYAWHACTHVHTHGHAHNAHMDMNMLMHMFAHAPPHTPTHACMHTHAHTHPTQPRTHSRTISFPSPPRPPRTHAGVQSLVETAMLASVSGLAYLLSSLLKLENSLGYLLPLPVVLASLRSGKGAGFRTVAATFFLLIGES